jgi:hypothetical protein
MEKIGWHETPVEVTALQQVGCLIEIRMGSLALEARVM